MSNPTHDDLNLCLYFNTNVLARQLSTFAEEEFMVTGLSAPYALLLLTVIKNPGIIQNDISLLMGLSPSTVTRFIDKLVTRNLLRRETSGKTTNIYPTKDGIKKSKIIQQSWENLYKRYCNTMGKTFAEKLTVEMQKAITKNNEG